MKRGVGGVFVFGHYMCNTTWIFFIPTLAVAIEKRVFVSNVIVCDLEKNFLTAREFGIFAMENNGVLFYL